MIDYTELMEKTRLIFNDMTSLMEKMKSNGMMDELITTSLLQKQIYDLYCKYRTFATRQPEAPQTFNRAPSFSLQNM
jgi:hypothetical protein